ncbi:MAG TPA: zinc-ribbon domain-containing protein [Candidatus Binatia bacterium]|nr:zinc-ribbon domain-containing protein [Candidatus Binatia bacterium]
MLLRCPKCRTTYKVSDDVLKGGPAPAFRCSRCKHTFELDMDSSPTATGEPVTSGESKPVAASDPELPLPFAAKPAEPVEDKAAALDERPPDADIHRDAPWSIGDRDQRDENPFTFPDAGPSAKSPKESDKTDDCALNEPVFPSLDLDKEAAANADNILPLATYLERRASIFPYLTLSVVLVIAYSLAAVMSYAHPKAAEEMVRKIPLIGASLLRNRHLKDGIVIQSLRAGYQTIQGNREVILINGVAVNQNPVVIREIQISGKIYNGEGKELEHQTIWAGNTLSPKILRGMTLEDIPHLQSLKPLKTFEVPPGDSVPFTIVFLRSKNAKDFSCEVLSAESEV